MFLIWWTGAVAWTWYAFAGSTTTALVSLALAVLPVFRVRLADRVSAAD
jgi:hypothetical protein